MHRIYNATARAARGKCWGSAGHGRLFVLLLCSLVLLLPVRRALAQDVTNTGTVHVNGTTTVYMGSNFTNNTTATVTNDGNIEVKGAFNFQNGRITEPNNGLVIFLDNATAVSAADASHVAGTVRKIGNDAFTFPTGDGGQYGPVGMSAPATVTAQVNARYRLTNPQTAVGAALGAGLTALSTVEYWELSGTPSVQVTLHWDSGSNLGALGSLADLRVAGWNGSQWVDLGNSATTGNMTTGTVTSNAVTPNSYQAYTIGSTVVAATADLIIGKSGPVTVTQGADFAYLLTITNTGSVASSGVITVANTLPPGLSFVSSSGGSFTCAASGQTVTCTRSTSLAANTGTAQITLNVNPTTVGVKANVASVLGGGDSTPATSNMVNTTVAAAPIPFLLNTVVVRSDGNDPQPGDNGDAHCLVIGTGSALLNKIKVGAAETETDATDNFSAACVHLASALPNLVISKSAPVTATQGVNFNYTLAVTNTGTVLTSGVVTVTDVLTSGLSFVGGSGGGFICVASGQTATCTRSTSMNMNVKYSITLVVKPLTPGAKTNLASVVGGGDTSPATSNTVNTTVVGVPDLITSIGQPTPSFTVGVASNVPLTVTNIGGAATTGPITATMTLPAGMSAPASFSNNGWSCTTSGQTVSCSTAGPLAPNGGSSTVQVPVTPDASTVGTTPTFTGTSGTAGETNTANNPATPMTPTVPVAGATNQLIIPVKAILGGAYNSATSLMRTNLRSLPDFPLVSPYGDGATITDRNVLTANQIVDWVLVELRSSVISSTVVVTQAGLLQADGDLVGIDGVSTFTIAGVTPGNYYLALHHRNHLPVMTRMPISVNNSTALTDFTLSTTPVYGSHARMADATTGVAMLWPGNAKPDDLITASGPGNDRSAVLQAVFAAPGNSSYAVSYIVPGYRVTDLNLDGVTLATGPNNDDNVILNALFQHPLNPEAATNFIIKVKLP
ncbi:MAG: hypothetical protein KF832_08380 [Caldilineaceae bacterium]|nr:hypothetical protein [Caldilineaceae bacterium]